MAVQSLHHSDPVADYHHTKILCMISAIMHYTCGGRYTGTSTLEAAFAPPAQRPCCPPAAAIRKPSSLIVTLLRPPVNPSPILPSFIRLNSTLPSINCRSRPSIQQARNRHSPSVIPLPPLARLINIFFYYHPPHQHLARCHPKLRVFVG